MWEEPFDIKPRFAFSSFNKFIPLIKVVVEKKNFMLKRFMSKTVVQNVFD